MTKILIDANALINLSRYLPPQDRRFKEIWDNLRNHIIDGRVILIKEIADELKKWKNSYLGSSFLEGLPIVQARIPVVFDQHMRHIIREVESRFDKGRIQSSLKWMTEEDPWLVAYALKLQHDGEDIIIITDEKTTSDGSRVKITSVCDILNITYRHSRDIHKHLVL